MLVTDNQSRKYILVTDIQSPTQPPMPTRVPPGLKIKEEKHKNKPIQKLKINIIKI